MAISACAFGQTYTIRTFAGGGLPQNSQGLVASLGGVYGSIAVDGLGNIYLALPDHKVIVRLDAVTGVLTRVAGNGTPGFSGDNGPATSAQLNYPQSVALDFSNNIYIGDTDRIRKVSNGLMTTVAGGGTAVPGDGGPATSAQLGTQISGLAVDSTGNLYIVDTNNNRVRRVSNGVITTFAGTGVQGFGGDNSTATTAQLNAPYAVAVDSAANLYIADGGNHRIRKVSSGVITTVAGNGIPGFSGDNGSATTARLFLPTGVAVDSAGNIYIADANNNRIRKVSNGVITTAAGNGIGVFSAGDNSPATSAQVPNPRGIAAGASGDFYIADLAASVSTRVRKVSGGVISTLAGAASAIGDDGPPTSAQLSSPWGTAVDSSGNVYIADTGNSRIRTVASGLISTAAGTGTGGFSGDNGPPPGAQLGYPHDVNTDSLGNVYIADTNNNRVRKISGGVITTVAGNGTAGFAGDDGPAPSAQLNGPLGVAVDFAGNLYIADSGNNRIRRVANGAITTIAGSGVSGFSGDNGPATSAQLSAPQRIAVDSLGNLYIADMGNNRIRKVANGVITTVAGGGTLPGDNVAATSAQLVGPRGVAVDFFGHLYIADQANARIRKVSNGVIATIAGGTPGFSGDNGPAVNAQLNISGAVAVDSGGNVFVADVANQRVRILVPSGAACSASVTPNSLSVDTTGSDVTFIIRTDPSCSWAVQSLPSWITYSGNVIGSGMGIITLAVAANTGSARSAIISVAGVSVLVTQQGGGACSYAINPGGQSWPVAGGSGTVSISAGTGCQWTATSTLSWVTITTSPASGSGNGTVSYQVAANTGDARAGNLTIAGLSYSVEQASASITNLIAAGSMAHLASAGYWKTTITLVNTGAAAAQARLNFFDNNGNPLMLPLSFPQSASSGALVASTVDRTLNPGAGLVIESTGPDEARTLVGWAQLLTNGSIGAFAIFRQQIGAVGSEAVVPFETRGATTYALWFDNTNGLITGVAVASEVPQAITIGVTIRDDTGAILGTDSISLSASGHTSYSLVDRFQLTSQRRGTIEFSTPAGGQISVLGIRFSPQGGFSTIPVLAK